VFSSHCLDLVTDPSGTLALVQAMIDPGRVSVLSKIVHGGTRRCSRHCMQDAAHVRPLVLHVKSAFTLTQARLYLPHCPFKGRPA
jgi:hypothetical protein